MAQSMVKYQKTNLRYVDSPNNKTYTFRITDNEHKPERMTMDKIKKEADDFEFPTKNAPTFTFRIIGWTFLGLIDY